MEIKFNHDDEMITGALGVSSERAEELVVVLKEQLEKHNEYAEKDEKYGNSRIMEETLKVCETDGERVYIAFELGHSVGATTIIRQLGPTLGPMVTDQLGMK